MSSTSSVYCKLANSYSDLYKKVLHGYGKPRTNRPHRIPTAYCICMVVAMLIQHAVSSSWDPEAAVRLGADVENAGLFVVSPSVDPSFAFGSF